MSIGSDPRIGINDGTMIVANPWAIVPIWEMKSQFERYYSDIREVLCQPGPAGYSVIAVYANHGLTGFAHLPMVPAGDPGGVLVVGRHDHAQLRLEADPTISLRHLAIRVLEGADGGPEARLIDLNTGQGFYIEGAGVFQGCQVSGPVFLRIGSYALMLFPRSEVAQIWPAEAGELFETLVHARVVRPGDDAPKEKAVRLDRGQLQPETRITQIGAPAFPKRYRPADGRLPEDSIAILTVEAGRQRVVFAVSAAQLERGVLLGRYERCEVETFGLWADEAASRVHLLLLKEGDAILAIDTASSNGTFVNGAPVEIVGLPEEATLELARGNTVRWQSVGDAEVHLPAQLEVVAPRPEPDSPVVDAFMPKRRSIQPLISRWRARREIPWTPRRRITIQVAVMVAIASAAMIVDALWERGDVEVPAAPQACIHPLNDFGTDSPGLRLFIQQQNPDVCFQYKWVPEMEEYLETPREPAPEPPPWLQ